MTIALKKRTQHNQIKDIQTIERNSYTIRTGISRKFDLVPGAEEFTIDSELKTNKEINK